ncbi:hypothetical protein Pelo_16832 [Pelomyxa schiedti]|nr:hypothetical protein Pelo_16832 [Pelomyxa schiedti]
MSVTVKQGIIERFGDDAVKFVSGILKQLELSTNIMSNNHTPPSQQRSDDDTNNTNIDGVLAVSRLVWDHVVSRGWLDGPRDSLGNIKCGPDGLRQWDLFRAAEAMFPIVGLVCRRVLAYDPRFGAYIGSYFAIATAASVPAPSCVAWILNNRHVRGRVDNDIRDPVFVVVAKPGSPPLGRARPQGDERGCGCGGGVEVGVVVKEVSATLAGLLMGGHVGLAAALFGGGVGHSEPRKSRGSTTAATATATTCNTTSCTLPRLWDGRRVVSWEMACHTNVNDPDRRRKMGGRGKGIGRGAGRGRRGGKGRSDNLRRGGVAGLREKVIEYARAECGNLQLVRGVCHAGRADGVRWLVDVLGIEGKEAQWLMYESMQSCVSDGKMEVVKWLCGSTALCKIANGGRGWKMTSVKMAIPTSWKMRTTQKLSSGW